MNKLKFKIDEFGYLNVSYDNGCSWESIGNVKGEASTVPGPQGEQGIQGPQGANGINGVDGVTPYISESTNTWIVNGEDTGIPASGGEVHVPSITSRREGKSTIILVDNKAIATINDGESYQEGQFINLNGNQINCTLHSGAGINITPNGTISTTGPREVFGLVSKGLHAQGIQTNGNGHLCEKDNYTRIVASRSNNKGRISFMFEVIGRDKEESTYYAKYLFNGQTTNAISEITGYDLYCIDYHASKASLAVFRPLESLSFTCKRNGNNTIISIYRKCITKTQDDIFVVNVLSENLNGPATREYVFKSTDDTYYSVQYWTSEETLDFDKDSSISESEIEKYDNNIKLANITSAEGDMKEASKALYNLDNLSSTV